MRVKFEDLDETLKRIILLGGVDGKVYVRYSSELQLSLLRESGILSRPNVVAIPDPVGGLAFKVAREANRIFEEAGCSLPSPPFVETDFSLEKVRRRLKKELGLDLSNAYFLIHLSQNSGGRSNGPESNVRPNGKGV